MRIQEFNHGIASKTVIRALEEDGAVIVKGALSPAQRRTLEGEIDPLLARTPNCEGLFHGYKTKRVGGLLGKSRMCQEMILDPTVLSIMDHFLLPHCERYQVNLTQLISIGPGEGQQIVHADDPLFPFDNEFEIMMNVMWMVDDFTPENGGTHIAPGSHKWARDRIPVDGEMVQARGPAGSYLVWLGSLRHGGGANLTNKWRRGIVLSYCLGWLRQSENQYLAIPYDVVKTFPEELQKLVGYTVHKPNLGIVEGRDPLEILRGNGLAGSAAFKDHLPDEMNDLLEKHHQGQRVMVA